MSAGIKEQGKLASFPEYIAPMSPVQFNRINNHFPPLDPRRQYRGVYERCGFDVYRGDGRSAGGEQKAKSAKGTPAMSSSKRGPMSPALGFQPPPGKPTLAKRPSLPDMNLGKPQAPKLLTKKNSSTSLNSLNNQQSNNHNASQRTIPASTPKSPSSVGSQSSRSSIRSAFFRPFKKNSKKENSNGHNSSAASSDYSSSAHTSISTSQPSNSVNAYGVKPPLAVMNNNNDSGGNSGSSSPLKSSFSPNISSTRLYQREFEKPSNAYNGPSNMPSSPSSIGSMSKNPFAPSNANQQKGLGITVKYNNEMPNNAGTNNKSPPYTTADNSSADILSPVSVDSANIFSPLDQKFSSTESVNTSAAPTPKNAPLNKGKFAAVDPKSSDLTNSGNKAAVPEKNKKSNSVVYNGFFAKKVNSTIAGKNQDLERTLEEPDVTEQDRSKQANVFNVTADSAYEVSSNMDSNTSSESFMMTSHSNKVGIENRNKEGEAPSRVDTATSSIASNDDFLNTIKKSFNSLDDEDERYNNNNNDNSTSTNVNEMPVRKFGSRASSLSDDGSLKESIINDFNGASTKKKVLVSGVQDEITSNDKSFAEKNQDKLMRKLTTKLNRISGQFGLDAPENEAEQVKTSKENKHTSVASSIYSVDDMEDDNDFMNDIVHKGAETQSVSIRSSTISNKKQSQMEKKENLAKGEIEKEDDSDEDGNDLARDIASVHSGSRASQASSEIESDNDLLDDIKSLKSNTNSLYMPSNGANDNVFDTSDAPSLPTIMVSDENNVSVENVNESFNNAADETKNQTVSASENGEDASASSSMAKLLFRDLQKKTSNSVNSNKPFGEADGSSAKNLYNDIEGILEEKKVTESVKDTQPMSSYDLYNQPIPAGISANTTAPINARRNNSNNGIMAGVRNNSSSSTILPTASSSSISLHTANTSLSQRGLSGEFSNPMTTSTSVSSLSEANFSPVTPMNHIHQNSTTSTLDNLNDDAPATIRAQHSATPSYGSINRSNTLDSIDSDGSDDSILRKIVNMDEGKESILNVTGGSANLNEEKPLKFYSAAKPGEEHAVKASELNFQNSSIPIANRIQAGRVELKDISELNKSDPSLHDTTQSAHNNDNPYSNLPNSTVPPPRGLAKNHIVVPQQQCQQPQQQQQSQHPLQTQQRQPKQSSPQQHRQYPYHNLQLMALNNSSSSLAAKKLDDPKLPPDYELPSPTSFKSQVSEDNELQKFPTVSSEDNYPKYPSGEGPCRKCHKEIQGKSIWSKDHQMSGRWHRACFSCYRCEKVFAKGTNCYVYHDKPYCSFDFHFLNHSLCRICEKGIEGKCLENNHGERFHPDCLTCVKCGVFIQKDYFVLDGKPLCEKDGLYEIEMEKKAMMGSKADAMGSGDPNAVADNGSGNGELQVTSKVQKRRTIIVELPENLPAH